MIGTNIGNYKIIDKIGEGGMGVVYKAEHVKLGKRFAIKSLVPELTRDLKFRERFEREGKNQARLEHPNIVQVTDFFEQNGQFFLIMEYIDGCGLDELIEKQGKLSEKQALSVFKQVLKGLNFAHSRGIIHRDVKPSNILVDKNGRAKIMDFGIAILAGERRLTATGGNIGSPCYMSPEQIRKPKHIDHRTDVYSMGIVLYEMLTGDVPFDSDTDSDYKIKEKRINNPVPDPIQKNPQISKPLAQIIFKALEKNPDDRFSGCGEFLEYIRAYEKREIIPEKYSSPILMKAIAILSIIALGIGLYFFQNKSASENLISVVKVIGSTNAINYNRLIATTYIEGQDMALLIRDNELMVMRTEDGEESFFQYTDGDGDLLSLKRIKNKVWLNNKLVYFKLSTDEDWHWLERSSRDDLLNLRTISFGTKSIDSSKIPLIKKIADTKPRLWIDLPEQENDIAIEVLSLFNPSGFSGHISDSKETIFLSLIKSVESLLININKIETLEKVSQLPDLKNLIIYKYPSGTPKYQDNAWSKLELLSICSTENIIELKNMNKIREIFLIGKVRAMDSLLTMPQLKTVSIKPEADISVLSRIANLTSIGFPKNVNQNEFASVIKSQPNLEIVDLSTCEKIKDISPLKNLKCLKAVILSEKMLDYATLDQIKKLRIIYLPDKTFEKGIPDLVKRIKTEHPDTLIVAGGGVCLGSGWILILMLLMIVISLVKKRISYFPKKRGRI